MQLRCRSARCAISELSQYSARHRALYPWSRANASELNILKRDTTETARFFLKRFLNDASPYLNPNSSELDYLYCLAIFFVVMVHRVAHLFTSKISSRVGYSEESEKKQWCISTVAAPLWRRKSV